MKNPIVNKIFYIFSSARVILDDKLFLDLLRKSNFFYISCISHNKLAAPQNVSVKSKPTIIIDLKRKPEDVLAGFNDTSRNEVRKTFKIDEYSFMYNDKNFDEIYKLYKSFRKSKNLPIKKPYFLRAASIYTAYYNNELISVVSFYNVYPYLRIQNIFSKDADDDKETRKIIGYATRRLIYEVCKFGCENGYTSFDLAGINLTDPAKKGITNFKSSFGGEVIHEYTYTYKHPLIKFLRK